MDLLIPIDRNAPAPLVEQVYRGLRAAIADGTLLPGARVPSTREFARQLGITRFTVDDAYSRLVGEGYLEGRHGSGTYVAEHVRMPRQPVPIAPVEGSGLPLSQWAHKLDRSPRSIPGLAEFDFTAGTPALDLLPVTVWQRIIAREARQMPADAFAYGDPAGLASLREVIAAYVGRSRGVACTPEQVVVTSGVLQSMDLLMRLALDPGASVVAEDPGYQDVRRIASLAGANVLPVPVDRDGLVVDRLPAPSADIRLVCVTPSHQYPTGAILSLQRRLELLAWAQDAGAIVLEDDYDSELRYDARPVPALAALASTQSQPNRVVYFGSFSKVLFPSLRLGYVVLPPDLVGPFVAAKATVDRQAPSLNQAAVATFVSEGHFERHLGRMRRAYSSRHDSLLEALDTHLPGIAWRDTTMTSAGLQVLVRFETELDEGEITGRAGAIGIALEGAGRCFTTPPEQPHFVMGYARLPEDQIREGIARLASIFR